MYKLLAASLPVCLACSEPARQVESEGEASIVPHGLQVSALPGGNGVLEVTALTLRKGEGTVELFAALHNVGKVPACHAAFAVELFDAREQSLAAGITGLLTQRFYRRSDGTHAIAACIAPGDRTMAAITDLPAELAVEDVSFVVYRCPYSALEVEPIGGLTIERVEKVARSVGTAYAGILVNELDVPVRRPSVTVFPVNSLGRPLGVAMGVGDVAIAPGGTWEFQTNTLDAHSTDCLAYPAAALETHANQQP